MGAGNGAAIAHILVNTNIAAATGALGALIGFLGGGLVVLGVLFFDRVRVDDPVGAVSVHLLNGIWGTLALGLFYDNQVATDVAALATGLSRAAQTWVQLTGIFWVGLFTFAASAAFWYALKFTVGVRVAEEEEVQGLDIGEHGNEAYPNFTPGMQESTEIV